MITIETHISQYASLRLFTEKSLQLQTDVGCSLNSLFAKRTCRLYATKLRTCTYGDVPMTGGGFDWRFFSFAISVLISPCLSGLCDFFQSLSHFLSLNRHFPPWVMVCFRSVILSLIVLLTTNARNWLLHGATLHLITRSR